jgi:hypothetical protein
MAFGRSFFGGSATTATSKATPTPTPKKVTTTAKNDQFALPTSDENALNITVPVVYRPGMFGAPDAGRNIFAFYEPPPPTPYQPLPSTPPPTPVVPPPTPAPTPVFLANSVGTKGAFKLEVSGDRFTPDARIYFNQSELPTNYVSSQQLTAMITENMVAQEGQRQIIVQTPNGMAYSGPLSMTVMAPPKPSNLQYIGMIGRKRYNNDTAYFLETGKAVPFGARLNDVVGARFRLIDISSAAVVLEDVNLGFKHRITITPASGPGNSQPGGAFVPYNPAGQGQANPNMQRMVPQPPRPDQKRPQSSKDDVDDNDDPPRPR